MNIIKNYTELYNWKTPIVVFDLETTGLNPNSERIIEIGAIRIENGEVIKTLSVLVNPGIEVPFYATKVNGITTEMLKNKMSDIDGIQLFLDMICDSVIVAHNVSFDVGFINSYLKRMGSEPLNNKLVDTVQLARKAFPGGKKYSLGIIAERLGIKVLDAHRAEDDARVCYELYSRSIEELKILEKL